MHHQQMYQQSVAAAAAAAAAGGYDAAPQQHSHHQFMNPYANPGIYGGEELTVGFPGHHHIAHHLHHMHHQHQMHLQVSVGTRAHGIQLPDPNFAPDPHVPLSVGFTPYVGPYGQHPGAPYGMVPMVGYGRHDGGGDDYGAYAAGGYGAGGFSADRGRGGGGYEGRGGPRRERGSRGGRGGRGGSHHGSLAPQSEFVQSFRANNGASKWRLVDIAGHAAEFARDQEGSRFIQAQLDIASPDEVNDLFHEIFEKPAELITDVFGNYVLQKMLEMATPEQLLFVASSLSGHVVFLTLQTYGCRVIQKCIEVMPPEAQNMIIAELEGNVAKCIQDQNGNHVIQKCVEVVPERCAFIVNAFSGRVKELATHAYGCRVIQCILQQCPTHEPAIFAELLQCIEELTLDQYGNYVVQHVLVHAKPGQIDAIVPKLSAGFYKFSTHKFASNVMEKFFAACNDAQRLSVVRQLTAEVVNMPLEDCGPEFGHLHPAPLYLMMKDQFGNYVVQQVIDMSSEALRKEMMDCAQKYVFALRRHPYGKHMVARLERAKLLVPPQHAQPQPQMVLQPSDASTVEGSSS
jgi:pumilio RNA-binding family